MTRRTREETRLIRTGMATGGRLAKTVGPPIQKGSTVLLPDAASLYDETQVTYGRGGLAAQNALMDALAELEGAKAVRLFPSGLAALTGALMAVLKAGDEVLVTDTIYKPTRRFCDNVLVRYGVTVRYFEPRTAPDALPWSPATRLVLMESPGSLTFEMHDVPAVAAAARARGALSMIDNTWGAGLLFKPLAHGVDLSVQALTKYVGGHSDVFMGSASAVDPDLCHALDHAVWDFGWAVSAEDAYQMLRGLRTLPTRMARHGDSSLKVARWLRDQPEVLQVLHPALPDDPGHAIWKRDFLGSSGLFSVILKPASRAAVAALLDNLELFGLGYSWGGFESLVIPFDCKTYRTATEWSPEGPALRFSVGLENIEDLQDDLDRGFAHMRAVEN